MSRRSKCGSFLADTPAALWVLFMILCFPLANLATVCLRAAFLYLGVHNATRMASRARSYLAPVAGEPSAVQLANTTANTVAAAWTGVHITNINTSIVCTDINTRAVTTQSTPLTTAADDTNYTYQLEVDVNGKVDPLITINTPWGPVPGLSTAVQLYFTDRQYVENPQGLSL